MADDFNNDSLRERYLTADISKVAARTLSQTQVGRETYYLHIHFNEGAKMENIRAFLLAGKLGEQGTVNRTIPANPETDPDTASAIVERGFYISYTSSLFREQIETLIKGALSVETVSFLRRMPDGRADAAYASEEANGARRGRPAAERPRPAKPASEPSQTIAASQEAQAKATKAPEIYNAVPPAADKNITRVEWKKLDNLLDIAGAILLGEPDSAHGKELQTILAEVRALPLSALFESARGAAADMGKELGKDVELAFDGASICADKWILDTLSGPLARLIANTVKHAVETPKERLAAGKITDGRIRLSARTDDSSLVLSVSDDGRGPELKRPGYAEYAAAMEAVKNSAAKLGGSVAVASKVGQGTDLTIKIPLRVPAFTCIIAETGKFIQAIPASDIRGVLRTDSCRIVRETAGAESVLSRGVSYPLIRLGGLFGQGCAAEDGKDGVLILADTGERSVCLFADRLVDKARVAVRPLSSLPREPDQGFPETEDPRFCGYAVTDNGPCPVLSLKALTP